MRDYLRTLNKNELFQLEKLLCTNEEINLAQSLSNSQQQNNNSTTAAEENTAECCDESNNKVTVIVPSSENKSNENFYSIKKNGDDNNSEEWVAEENTEGRDEIDEKEGESSENYDDENLVTADCSTGYLVPNTNLGNLLQSNVAPLTYNIIISSSNEVDGEEQEENEANEANEGENNLANNRDSGVSTGNDQSPDQETSSTNVLVGNYDENWENLRKIVEPSSSSRNQNGTSSHRHHHHHSHHHHKERKYRKSRKLNQSSSSSSDDSSSTSSASSSPTSSTASTSSTGTIEVGMSSRDISRRAKFK